MSELNLVRNGELEVYGAGPVPSFMAAQVTNTAASILDIRDAPDAPARFAFGTNFVRGERYVGEGERSYRLTIAAAAAIDAFRLHPLNVNPLTFLGATAPVVALVPARPYVFSFLARCSVPGNLITARIIMRDAAAVRLTAWNATGEWIGGAAADVDFGMDPRWQRHSIRFVAPAADDAGNLITNVVWQISNGTAGAQIIDLDDIRMRRTDDDAAA